MPTFPYIIFALLGFATLGSGLLNVPITLLLFSVSALFGTLMFLFILFGKASLGAFLLLLSGNLLFLHTLHCYLQKGPPYFATFNVRVFLLFTLTSYVLFFYATDMAYRSIADYSFWGTVSQYVYSFGRFPDNDDYLQAQFLQYVPGISSFHYLFYSTYGGYSVITGYVAQGILIASGLLVLLEVQRPWVSLSQMGITLFILMGSFGVVLLKMEVDAYVALFIIVITWLIHRYHEHRHLAWLIFFPILFLSLIKDIGMFFAFLTILIYLIRTKEAGKWWHCGALLLGLLTLKGVWLWHDNLHHFPGLAHVFHLHGSFGALTWFRNESLAFQRFATMLLVPFTVFILLIGMEQLHVKMART